MPDTKVYGLDVTSTTKAIKAIVSYPSLSYAGVNEFDYHLSLADAAGTVVAESTASPTAGMSQLFADLTKGSYAYGGWTITVSGDLGAQDQDTIMGIRVSLVVSQLTPQTRVSPTLPVFTATGSKTFYFLPGPAGLGSSPEGCNLQVGAPVAALGTSPGSGACQSGSMGYAVNFTPGIGTPASFTSAVQPAALTVGGRLTLKFYLADPAQPVWVAAQNPRFDLQIDAVDDNGELLLPIAAAEWKVCNTVNGTFVCNAGPQATAGVYTIDIPPATIPAGSHVSVLVSETGVVSSTSTTAYGGRGLSSNFSDAAVTLTTGTVK